MRVWRPSWPCPVGAILRQQRRGFGDPTYRIEGEGPGARHWRGLRTPSGPATLMIQALPRLGEVVAEAWGPGADWALGSVPGLLGAHDDPSGFEPRHPVLAELHRRYPHWRLGRTDRVFEALVPSIVEQKVTGKEAFAGFRALVHFHGERAPGAGATSRSCGSSRAPRCCAASRRGSGCACTSTRLGRARSSRRRGSASPSTG